MVRVLAADPLVFLWGAVLLLTVPFRWLFAAGMAALFHELCHYLVLRAAGGRVHSLQLRVDGMRMETGPLSPGRELACALAGPAGSLLLVTLGRWMPRITLCGLVQGIYNLLPVYPLDGGRALRCAWSLLGKDRDDRMLIWIERGCLTGVIFLAVATAYWLQLGIFPVLAALILIIRAKERKIPCKPEKLGVQ